MYLKAASGGQIELNLQTEKATASANSGGVINVKGTTFSFEAVAKSGGVIKANEFLSSQTEALFRLEVRVKQTQETFLKLKLRLEAL